MVSYFVPRGRFLIKAGNLRQAAHLKQHQQQQQGKWPMPILRHFRQTFSAKVAQDAGPQGKVDSLARRNNTLNGNKSPQNEQKTCAEQQRAQLQKQRHNAWQKWTGFLLRWTPVGICLFGVIEWQLHKQKCQREQVPRIASTFQSKVYCSLPLRIMSRCWGWLAACYIPQPLRPYLYGLYASFFNVNMEEALHPDYKYYTSLAEFFTRELREGVRPIDQQAPLVSPVDGRVLHFGSATNSRVEQVKGVNYSVQSFLGPPPKWTLQDEDKLVAATEYAEMIKEKHDNSTTLYQCIIYLAPGDYHRFHSPAEWQPAVRRHFAGELLSVNPRIASWLPKLFCLNERAVYMGKWEYGFFSYTAVGATNVGSVQIYMDEKLKTNRWVGLNVGTYKQRHVYDELPLSNSVKLSRGELLGQFNMGSTIVLLFEAPKTFKFDIEAGQKIYVGQPLGHFEPEK